jgi:tagaturonate reductase
VAKYAARVLPTIKEFHAQKGTLPTLLTFSFAALVNLYKGSDANDDKDVMEFMARESVENICANTKFWGSDLTQIPGFVAAVSEQLGEIEKCGTRAVIARLLECPA